jgi:Fic family protein
VKLPQTPPAWLELLPKLAKPRQAEVFRHIGEVAKNDRYLPWDEVRRRPAPHGLSREEWWLALKFSREARLRAAPLRDKTGKPFWMGVPDSVLQQLHEIDRGLGFAVDLPDAVTRPETRDHYIISSLIQESITSSQLEGAATTREVAKEMLRSGRAPRDKSERMILNNYRTMQRICAAREKALTPELVLEIHALVTADTLDKPDAAGRLRRSDENIRVEDFEGTVFHVPPGAKELAARLAAMCDFANGKTPEFFVHPIVRGIVLHFWLAYDHPFVDGNGRTARALFYWSMLRQDYRLFEFISISQILLRAPARYARAFLHTETDGNDLTYFILHQTEVIREAVEALHAYVKHKTDELRVGLQRLRGLQGLNHRQQALLTHALREPHTRYLIGGHGQSHGVSFQTARNDLFDLADRGLLTVRKEGRHNAFHAPHDLGEKLSKLAEARAPAQPDANLTLPLAIQPEAE